jgi:hypothetical protein
MTIEGAVADVVGLKETQSAQVPDYEPEEVEQY